MKEKVCIIAGHYGRGTGAVYEGRDEFELAKRDTLELYYRIFTDNLVQPFFFHIDREDFRWKILGDMLSTKTQISIKANWVRAIKPACAIELHYNSAEKVTLAVDPETGASRRIREPLVSVSGHEVVTPEESEFALCIDKALDGLENKKRRLFVKNNLLLFRRLKSSGVPTIIIEPAFIFEDGIETDEWTRLVAEVVSKGIYSFLALGDEHEV